MFLTESLASVVGCCIAAIATERFHPKYVFFIYGFFGLFLAIIAFFLSNEAEREYLTGEEPEPSDFSSEVKFG